MFEQSPFQVNLEKRVLEDILRKRGIIQVAGQVAVQLPLIPMDEFGEDIGMAFLTIPTHQRLIGELAEIFRRIRSNGLNHLTYRRGQRFRESPGNQPRVRFGPGRVPHDSPSPA